MFETMIEMSYVTHTNEDNEFIIINVYVGNQAGPILQHTDYIRKNDGNAFDWNDAMKRFETFSEAPDTRLTYNKIVPDTDAHFTTYTLSY
jgi:hypothetical protein